MRSRDHVEVTNGVYVSVRCELDDFREVDFGDEARAAVGASGDDARACAANMSWHAKASLGGRYMGD